MQKTILVASKYQGSSEPRLLSANSLIDHLLEIHGACLKPEDLRDRLVGMKENADTRASMIVNFDSTEQLRQWKLIENSAQIGRQLTEALWLNGENPCACARILNTHPEFVRYFSGILRTAYLYCPKIVLTDVQLFDGYSSFFSARLQSSIF